MPFSSAPFRTSLIGLAALLLTVLLAPAGRAQLKASAEVDRYTIGAGEMLLLTLEIEGDLSGLDAPQPPATRNLALVDATPQRRVELRIANGKRTERLTLQWTYQPLGTGSARLGPIRVSGDGGAFSTDPITVNVVAQAQRPPLTATTPRYGSPSQLPPLAAPESGMEVRAEASTTAPYVGQQVVVDYVLVYDPTRFQPQESQLLGAWEAGGLWREEMDVPYGLSIPRTNAEGTRREVTIKRIAVFPARAGTLQIEPIALEVGGRRQGAGGGFGGGGLFDALLGRRSRYVEERVEMPAVTLDARPLPGGAPPSFTGAVGHFQMTADLDPQQVADGAPVRLEIDVRGTGNVALLDSPEVPLPDGVTRYDIDEERRTFRGAAPLNGQKRFTHQLAAEYAGTFPLPVEWSYFDPDADAYRTLRAEPTLRVVGAAAPRAEAEAPEAEQALPEVAWEKARAVRPLHRRPWVWAGLGLPLLALLGLVAARRVADHRADASPTARRRRAPAAARAALDAARTTLLHDARAGTAQLDAAVRQFLHDRFGLAPGLPRPALDAALATRGVDADARARLLALLAACEDTQFAPGHRPATPALVDDAADLLAALDQTPAPDRPALP